MKNSVFQRISGGILAVFVVLLLVANTGLAQQSQLPVIGIEVFLDNGTLNNRVPADKLNAIDGDTNTVSFLTNAFEANPNTVALDFGSLLAMSRLRVAKRGDSDGTAGGAPGLAPIDNMDLTILFSTDTGPLESRTYQPVTGLTNGFQGTELINADTVNSSNGTVDNDHHDFATSGFYSLTFDPVAATAFAIRFARDAGDSAAFTHYSSFEIEVYNDAANVVPTLTEWGIFGLILLLAAAGAYRIQQTTQKHPATYRVQ